MGQLSRCASLALAGVFAASAAMADENNRLTLSLDDLAAQQSQTGLEDDLNRICGYYARQNGVNTEFLTDRVRAYLSLSMSQGNNVTFENIDMLCRADSSFSVRFEEEIANGTMADGECTIVGFGGKVRLGQEVCNLGGVPVLRRHWDNGTPQAEARNSMAFQVDDALEAMHEYKMLTGQKPAGSPEPRGYLPVYQHLLDGGFENVMQEGECRSDAVTMSDGLDYSLDFCETGGVLEVQSITTPDGVTLRPSP